MRTAAAVTICAVALLAAGGGEQVASVGTIGITEEQVEHLLEQGKERYLERGAPFPEPGEPDYRPLRDQAVRVLVDRAVLERGAEELGVDVDDEAVEQRLEQLGGGEPEEKKAKEGEGEVSEDDVRAQLLYEAVYAHLARGVRVTQADVARYHRAHPGFFEGQTLAQATPRIRAELLGARRNAAMSAWLERERRDASPLVRYEPGWRPA